jgi:hypothetical protein
MSAAVLRQPIRNRGVTQPVGPLRLNRKHPLARGLIFSAYNSLRDIGRPPRNYVDGTVGAGNGTTITTQQPPAASSALGGIVGPLSAPGFGGTSSDIATHPISLAPYRTLTCSFWLWWNAYGSDDAPAFRYGGAGASCTGFSFNPNWSTGGNTLVQVFTFSNNTFSIYQFPHTAMAVQTWNHIVFQIDNTLAAGQAGLGCIINGVAAPSFTAQQNTQSANVTFSDGTNGTLRFMQHPVGPILATGRISNFNLWSRIVRSTEYLETYYRPWSMFERDAPMPYAASAAGGGGGGGGGASSSRWFLAA